MLIAKYNGLEYLCTMDGINVYILTSIKEKATEEFLYEEEKYYKEFTSKEKSNIFNIEEISDIFELQCWVEYDTKLDNVPKKWEVSFDLIDFTNDSVTVYYSYGHLPNWTICDKYMCSKTLTEQDISSCKIVKHYIKKDNILFDQPKIIEEIVDFNTLIKTLTQYQDENI